MPVVALHGIVGPSALSASQGRRQGGRDQQQVAGPPVASHVGLQLGGAVHRRLGGPLGDVGRQVGFGSILGVLGPPGRVDPPRAGVRGKVPFARRESTIAAPGFVRC